MKIIYHTWFTVCTMYIVQRCSTIGKKTQADCCWWKCWHPKHVQGAQAMTGAACWSENEGELQWNNPLKGPVSQIFFFYFYHQTDICKALTNAITCLIKLIYIVLWHKIRTFLRLKSVRVATENPAKQYSLGAVKLSSKKSVKYTVSLLTAKRLFYSSTFRL